MEIMAWIILRFLVLQFLQHPVGSMFACLNICSQKKIFVPDDYYYLIVGNYFFENNMLVNSSSTLDRSMSVHQSVCLSVSLRRFSKDRCNVMNVMNTNLWMQGHQIAITAGRNLIVFQNYNKAWLLCCHCSLYILF